MWPDRTQLQVFFQYESIPQKLYIDKNQQLMFSLLTRYRQVLTVPRFLTLIDIPRFSNRERQTHTSSDTQQVIGDSEYGTHAWTVESQQQLQQ